MDISPITLTGRYVRLEPISEAHVPDLATAGADETIWAYMPYGLVTTEEKMRAWVLDLIERQKRGGDLPFAVIQLESGRAVGSTRYMEINRANRWLEIGGTLHFHARLFFPARQNNEAPGAGRRI